MTSRVPCVLARPTRCSTVTPGKLATFWRRPVRRLNSVDLPEFGGPMMATTCGGAAGRAGDNAVATAQPSQLWHSLIARTYCRTLSMAAAELIALRSRAGELSRIHPRGRHAAPRRERCEPE